MAREITYNNFEMSLVVFMPNITTNHAITYTYQLLSLLLLQGSPIFVAESLECEYLFTWQTPSACALTLEEGDNCTVEDKQYGYMFDLSRLYNASKDYSVNVSGVSGVRIILNVCNRLVDTDQCKKGSGACIIIKGE